MKSFDEYRPQIWPVPRMNMQSVRVAADVGVALSLAGSAWYAYSTPPSADAFRDAWDYQRAVRDWADTHTFLRTALLILFVSTAVLLLIRALGWRAASTVKENP
jgi:hypothetical protein